MNLRVYTDGSCRGNPGAGGYAAIIFDLDGKFETKIRGGEIETTNNKMELVAVVKALQYIESLRINRNKKYRDIKIFSDSAYVVNAIKLNWLEGWRKNNWKTKKGVDVKSKELWIELIRLIEILEKDYRIEFIKIKGHTGNKYNELADEMAKNEAHCRKKYCYKR